MPKGPKGQKRPADVISNAVHVMRIATGEIEDAPLTEDGKNKAAVQRGSRELGVRRRKEIARKAAEAKWKKTPK
jgi:hypothetical protein